MDWCLLISHLWNADSNNRHCHFPQNWGAKSLNIFGFLSQLQILHVFRKHKSSTGHFIIKHFSIVTYCLSDNEVFFYLLLNVTLKKHFVVEQTEVCSWLPRYKQFNSADAAPVTVLCVSIQEQRIALVQVSLLICFYHQCLLHGLCWHASTLPCLCQII